MARYNLGKLKLHQPISIIFGINITETKSTQTMIYFPTSSNQYFWQAGKTWKHENRMFSFKWCITALPEFNQLLFDFFSVVDLQLIIMLLYVAKSCTRLSSAVGCWGHSSGEHAECMVTDGSMLCSVPMFRLVHALYWISSKGQFRRLRPLIAISCCEWRVSVVQPWVYR